MNDYLATLLGGLIGGALGGYGGGLLASGDGSGGLEDLGLAILGLMVGAAVGAALGTALALRTAGHNRVAVTSLLTVPAMFAGVLAALRLSGGFDSPVAAWVILIALAALALVLARWVATR